MLRDARQPFSIITRGPLIVRDAELLAEASRRADVSVTFSVPTLDDDVWRTTEPGTSPPRQRLRALERARRAWRAGVGRDGAAPPRPLGSPDQIRRVVEAARAAGACGIWANLLYLKPGTKEHFMECLARDWPELLADYEQLYARRAYLAAADAEPARDAVRRLARAHGIRDRRPEPLRPPPRPEQLSLLSSA